MVALTAMYSILFIIIRQTRKMRTLNSSTSSDFYKSQGTASEVSLAHESDPWPTQPDATKFTPGANQIPVPKAVHLPTAERFIPENSQWRKSRADETAKKRMNNVSTTLLCYPIAYLCIIMPITVSRIAEF